MKFWMFGIVLECAKGKNILDRIQRRIWLRFEQGSLGLVIATPLFVILHFERLGAVLLDDGRRVGFLCYDEVNRID